MKKRYLFSFLVFLLITLEFPMLADSGPVRIELNSNWRFQQARLTNWYPATVPGVVHTDLMDNGIIEDPFFRLNERGVQWVDKEDWIYETSFDLSSGIMDSNNMRLLFEGLDTYADVYLNDSLILKADNMFRTWKVDIKGVAKEGENTLRILFHSPLKIDIPKWDALPFQYEAGNDQSENGGLFNKKVSIFARKAGYHYGWDWGPRLVTSGIWRPVYIEVWNDLKIEDVHIRQKSISAKRADLTFDIEVISDKDVDEALFVIRDNTTGKIYTSFTTGLSRGLNRKSIDLSIKNPALWWCNGMGDPNLYDFNTEVSVGKSVKESKNIRTGLRSLKIIRNPDKWGTSFYFELNGIPVFSKGANYIPNDSFLPRVSDSIYRRTVEDAVAANMNTLRIWGGGIYEADVFYDLCDEMGIMVWQDFMFACSLYPGDEYFLENVRQEAIDNVVRLRNHPSIALWCGNNENQLAWFNWGWKRRYSEQNPLYAELIWREYEDLFHKLLPEIVDQYHPESFYWPSSPFSRYDGASDPKHGDYHYWEVWHAKKPISEYNKFRSRFFSEYGFQSFPEFESVKKYAPLKEDWSITSEVMMSHQRGGAFANSLIEDYLLNEYRSPKEFTSFLYMNQVLQGDAIKTAIEAHRRDMPYCMGSLYWQHNDCWPVASWSGIDYYGKWKAQHYMVQKAFDDILVSPIREGDQVNVYIVSDRLQNSRGVLSVSIVDMKNGSVIPLYNAKKVVKSLGSQIIHSVPVADLERGYDLSDIVLYVSYADERGKIYDNSYFLLKQKEINYPQVKIEYEYSQIDDGYLVTLKGDNFARAIFLSLEGGESFCEENYFNLLPSVEKSVKIITDLPREEFLKRLRITHLREGY